MADDAFDYLHLLVLKGNASTSLIADILGNDIDQAATTLDSLQASGRVLQRSGRIAGWGLTADGRQLHDELLTAEADTQAPMSELREIYTRFVPVNAAFKALCTDWQLRTVDGQQVPNDHSDAGHDEKVHADLRVVHAAALPLCAEMSNALPRFGRYARRLSAAEDRFSAGDLSALTAPLRESYHDVWMELHQDLLLTLRLTRGEGDY
jgi:hypothetical protein